MSDVRLPTSVVPSVYDVALIPNLKDFTFQGHVSITVQVVSATNTITLHSADLSYPGDAKAITLSPVDSPSTIHAATELSLDPKHQRATFTFADGALVVGQSYLLHIRFDGILNDQLCGFYRSQYKSPSGETKYMAVTQFEATDARRALPCWDEPAVKAKFYVTLFTENHLTAVSNMPVVIKRTVADSSSATESSVSRGLTYSAGLIRYEYAPTPIMSTYILAFVVGEFDYISRFTKGGVEVRIYTPVGKTHLGNFSLDVSVKALEFYNHYFGIDYPLPKVDLLAIPDFAAGAMENWGCITYREIALLIDPEHSSAAVKQRCAKTVCHELAHMWFGNLVTMEWWTYLWLNEGFARFMEHVAVNHIFPDWHIWNQFVSDVYSTALALDGLETSHPVEVPVHEPEEINEIFDTISYAKGASLIRMLNDTIGDDAFERGVKLYLKRWSWKNTKTEDLWDALSEASGQNIAHLMDTWVKRMGYPVLSITETSSSPRTFTITQQRYLSNGQEEKGEHQHWNVPIIVGVYGKQNVTEKTTIFLNKATDTFTLPSSFASDSVIKFNVAQSGFFRIQYDTKLFEVMGNAIEQSLFPPTDRLGIHRDSFALATSGRIPISTALDLLQHFTHETSYPVVSAITSSVGALTTIHNEQHYYKQLQAFIAHLFRAAYTRFGWEAQAGEDHVTSLFRAAAISMMAAADDQDVVKQCISRVQASVKDEKSSIPADLRGSVYATASKHGGDVIRDILLTHYRKTELAEEKQRILAALGKNVAAVQANLEFAFSSEVRTGDVPYIIASIASSSQSNRSITWQYLRTNWNIIQERFTKGSSFLIGHLMDSVLSGFLTVAEAESFESFFREHPCAPADRTIKQASETVRTRAARLLREKEPLQKWLTQHQF